MEPIQPPGRPEREETDESLRKEREKSDLEVHRHLGRAADTAEAVVEKARDDADAVLEAAREASAPQPTPVQREARSEEDEAIHRQRADVALNNRDDFLGIVAHDLRGFMGEIAYRAAALVRHARDDEDGRRARQTGQGIQRSTAGMKRLVGDLLDIAAIEAGRLHVEVARGDLAGVLRDAAEPFRFAAQAKGLVLELEETPESVAALFDHDRVIQVLGNLVSNSIKFTPSGGKISLRLTVEGEEVRLTVADTGAGIPADKLEHIFERFTQLARADRRGLGLGLYISTCLVEAQHGRIWATSVPGAGSELCFTLPRAR